MQIKKFTAPTLREATFKMKDELGSEAVILGTRLIENTNGLRNEKVFEVTAGIENDVPFKSVNESAVTVPQPNFAAELLEMTKRFSMNTKPDGSIKQSADEKSELSSDRIKKLIADFHEKDVNRKVVSSVIDQLKKYRKFLHSSNFDNYVLSVLSSMVDVHEVELKKAGFPKVLSFVGPTGVGKTTCIAKLAVITKILHKLDVGLISIDTYRLGAIDQLKIFSEISKTDLLVAYEPEDIKKHMHSFRKKDIVFIDTAGRSPRNTAQLQKTKGFLDGIKNNEVFLVLSTASTTKSMIDAAEKFEMFDYSSFIFTKIDEAVTYGSIINLIHSTKKPAAYLSNGQTIPDDIITADSEFIANMIIKGNYQDVEPG